VTASIPAGVAHDAASNDNTASSSTDHTVSYIFWDWIFLPLIMR